MEELEYCFFKGCAVVEPVMPLLVALNQSTQTHFYTAVMSLFRDVVVGFGALMLARPANSVTLYPLMLQMIHQCGADRFTGEMFCSLGTATLVGHGVLTDFESRKMLGQYFAVVRILRKRWGVGSKVETITVLMPLWLGLDKWSYFPELWRKLEVPLLTVGKFSYTLDSSDGVAEVMDLELEFLGVTLRAQLALSSGSIT